MVEIAFNTDKTLDYPAQTGWLSLAVVLWLCVTWLFVSPAQAQFGDLVVFESPGETTYHLDADTGNDENPGTRPELAWKSLTRVNATRFAPGDKILIKAGTAHHGRLWPKGSGVPGNPITIDRYGEGPRPAIHADGQTSEALLLENQQAWHILNLELTNTGDKPEAFRYGVHILIEDMGTAGDFRLVNLHVHDVNGTPKPGLGEGGGIIWRNRGTTTPTRFDGMLIERCVIEDCGRNGIASESGFTDRRRWLSNLNVVISENDIKRIAGDGIRLVGCENAMIEYNRVQQAGGAPDGRAGGIVLQSCDNALVQYNEVWQTQGKDSAALRCGLNGRDNVLQFNYTHDNAGVFAEIVGAHQPMPAGARPTDSASTAVRYNVSQDDAGGAFLITGPAADTVVYNNTVYTGPDITTTTVAVRDTAGRPTGIIFANNLFYTAGRATLDLGETPGHGIHFLHNAYFGLHDRPDNEPGAVTTDPALVAPGQGQEGRGGLDGYQTLPGSPLRNAGTRLRAHGSHDFAANPIPHGQKVDIGAFQGPSDNPEQDAQPARQD